MESTRVSNFYDSSSEFDDILEQAEANANNDFEMEFTESVREKFVKWGFDMFFSEKQRDILERIANR